MVSLSCSTDHRDGVTLVAARVEGTGVAQRVRLTNRLDGPVWPPRRQGVPEAGWDEESFETVVPADETVAVGYASPAPPADPPVAVVEREVVDESAERDAVEPADALRKLGDPKPPRDAVPVPRDDRPDSWNLEEPGESPDATASEQPRSTRNEQPNGGGKDGAAPEAVTAWLDAVEERVAAAEELAAAESVPEATAALRSVGSLDDTEALVETLDREAAALEAVAARAERLADRTDAADVPLATFERLA